MTVSDGVTLNIEMHMNGTFPGRMFHTGRETCGLVSLLLLLFFCQFAWSDAVYMKDGKVYEQVEDLRQEDTIFIFRAAGKNVVVSKHKVEKIVGQDGRTVFAGEKLTVEESLDLRPTEFTFLKNGEETGKCAWNEKGKFVVISGEIPDGLYKGFYDSGKLKAEFPIERGRLNGNCRAYFQSGKAEKEAFFEDGRESGVSKLFYKSGRLKAESTFRKGLKQGVTTLYYESGALKGTLNFSYGKVSGTSKMYYESEQLELKVTFKHGEKHGPIKKYYESGELKLEGSYNAGKLDGLVSTYYKSGRLKKVQHFRNGRILQRSPPSSAAGGQTR